MIDLRESSWVELDCLLRVFQEHASLIKERRLSAVTVGGRATFKLFEEYEKHSFILSDFLHLLSDEGLLQRDSAAFGEARPVAGAEYMSCGLLEGVARCLSGSTVVGGQNGLAGSLGRRTATTSFVDAFKIPANEAYGKQLTIDLRALRSSHSNHFSSNLAHFISKLDTALTTMPYLTPVSVDVHEAYCGLVFSWELARLWNEKFMYYDRAWFEGFSCFVFIFSFSSGRPWSYNGLDFAVETHDSYTFYSTLSIELAYHAGQQGHLLTGQQLKRPKLADTTNTLFDHFLLSVHSKAMLADFLSGRAVFANAGSGPGFDYCKLDRVCLDGPSESREVPTFFQAKYAMNGVLEYQNSAEPFKKILEADLPVCRRACSALGRVAPGGVAREYRQFVYVLVTTCRVNVEREWVKSMEAEHGCWVSVYDYSAFNELVPRGLRDRALLFNGVSVEERAAKLDEFKSALQ